MARRAAPAAGDNVLPQPAMPPQITRRNFGRNHAYYLDGVKIPGVTTIIGNGVPKPALTRWAARVVAEYVADNLEDVSKMKGRNSIVGMLSGVPWDQRDSAAMRGTEVHALAEKYHAGEEIEIPDAVKGYVESMIRFLEEWQPRDELLELVVVNKRWRYAGTLDLIATLRDGKRWLIDYKTGRSGIFAETALQLAAYRNADWMLVGNAELPMAPVDCCGAVWLRDDGYSFYPVDAGERAFKTFLWAKGIAGFSETGRSMIGEELEQPR